MINIVYYLLILSVVPLVFIEMLILLVLIKDVWSVQLLSPLDNLSFPSVNHSTKHKFELKINLFEVLELNILIE